MSNMLRKWEKFHGFLDLDEVPKMSPLFLALQILQTNNGLLKYE